MRRGFSDGRADEVDAGEVQAVAGGDVEVLDAARRLEVSKDCVSRKFVGRLAKILVLRGLFSEISSFSANFEVAFECFRKNSLRLNFEILL